MGWAPRPLAKAARSPQLGPWGLTSLRFASLTLTSHFCCFVDIDGPLIYSVLELMAKEEKKRSDMFWWRCLNPRNPAL